MQMVILQEKVQRHHTFLQRYVIKLKISELLNSYNFHDSLVDDIQFKDNKVVLKIDLCNWKQKNYKSSEAEMKNIELIFSNIEDYELDARIDTVDSDTILEFKYDGNSKSVKLVLEDEDDIKILKFKGENVDIFYKQYKI